ISRSRIDEWFLGRVLEEQLNEIPIEKYDLNAKNSVLFVKILVSNQNWFKKDNFDNPDITIRNLLKDPEVQYFLNVNRHQNVLWFNAEQFAKFIKGITTIALLELVTTEDDPYSLMKKLESVFMTYRSWNFALSKSEYKLDNFLRSLK
ncbi:MAG: hypothetical protein ACTSRJ_05680, partial [Candidatus Hodarchaeales archaeon]